jgi:hypothetical protein
MKPASLSIPHLFLYEQETLLRFRRALRRADQYALDDLLHPAHKQLAELPGVGEAWMDKLPFEVFLVFLFLEEYKEVLRLRQTLAFVLAAMQLRDD